MSKYIDSHVERMKKSVVALKEEFNTIRTGRASASLFDKVSVDYYGEKTPLNQVSTISVAEARLIVIQPWDKNLINDIEKAIQKSELSLNPSNDGKVIRISIPPLTDERRKELVKQAKNIAEQSRIAIRNIRRDGNDDLKKLQKENVLTEDSLKKEEDNLQKMTDKHVQEINSILEEKRKGNNGRLMSSELVETIDLDQDVKQLPQHIAIIMDGNGRWAKRQGLSRTKGHKEGLEVAKSIVKRIVDLKIPYITLFTFSTENWKRTTEEVGFLMNLIKIHLKAEFDFYVQNNIRVRCIGDIQKLPIDVAKEIKIVEEETKKFSNTTVVLAINYGGKNEIIRAVKKLNIDNIQKLNEHSFNFFFDIPDLPAVDLLIRTGNEKRISNFLLWHAAYAELYFSDLLWPDWRTHHLDLAIKDFLERNRRYGGL